MKQPKPAPLLRFRVYPEEDTSGLYFLVFIWRTKKELHAVGRKEFHLRPNNYAGFCGSYKIRRYKKRGYGYTVPICGEIHFCKNSLTMRIITHEATHALVSWAKRVKLDPTVEDDSVNASPQEERYCHAMGEICRQIVLRSEKLIPR